MTYQLWMRWQKSDNSSSSSFDLSNFRQSSSPKLCPYFSLKYFSSTVPAICSRIKMNVLLISGVCAASSCKTQVHPSQRNKIPTGIFHFLFLQQTQQFSKSLCLAFPALALHIKLLYCMCCTRDGLLIGKVIAYSKSVRANGVRI